MPGPHAGPAAPVYACLYRPPVGAAAPPDIDARPRTSLEDIAREFSPRYERHHDNLVSIDVSGLERLLGPARVIGDELRRQAVSHGLRVHVAVAGTRMAALVLAHAQAGVTVVAPGDHAAALAPVSLAVLHLVLQVDGVGSDTVQSDRPRGGSTPQKTNGPAAVPADTPAMAMFKRWGLKTFGELAALPRADLMSRLGRPALVWQAIARGEDIRPLVPTLEEERFEASLDLEWPIDGLEPLSFVLTRLLEPLSTRLERRDRGTAVLHVILRLVTREPYARRLELPSPMRDVRTLRTLVLLDLESHPPDAAIDRVTIVIDPTPGRILQHTLFTRAHPTPEQLSTLLARLGALMGQDRVGAPVPVDSYRPGAFTTMPFSTEHGEGAGRSGLPRRSSAHDQRTKAGTGRARSERRPVDGAASSAVDAEQTIAVISAVRRNRQPVPARVAVHEGRPVRVTTDRAGFTGGSVVKCVGPWRSSGNWWNDLRLSCAGAGGPGTPPQRGCRAGGPGMGAGVPHPPALADRAPSYGGASPTDQTCWNHDEWDVALNDGAVYRVYQDRDTGRWFIDAIVD
jgi:protein ImuB